MTQTAVDAVESIAAKIATVNGLSATPAYPPESMGETTFAIVFVLEGRMDSANAGASETFLNIAVDVLTVRNDLAEDMARLVPFLNSVPTALLEEVRDAGNRFEDVIETFSGLVFEYLPSVDYGGVQMVGYRFVLQNVKLLVNL